MANPEDHAERIVELVGEFECLAPDDPVRDRVLELLAHIDHLHRSCIGRLYELLVRLGGTGLVDRLTTDRSVQLLFALYDLMDVERLQPAPVAQPPASFIPLSRIGNRIPAWRDAVRREELLPDSLRGLEIDGVPVLLCALGDQLFAYRNACPRSILPLHLGSLQGNVLRCPWHACLYDVPTGMRVDRDGPGLEAFGVTVRDGMVLVAVAAPRLAPPPASTGAPRG